MSAPPPDECDLPPSDSAPVARAGSELNDEFARLYDPIREVALRVVRREPSHRRPRATSLVHETYVRLRAQGHKLAIERERALVHIARIMRQILTDRARERAAAKRGGDRARVAFDEDLVGRGDDAIDLIAIDDLLRELEHIDERVCRVVEGLAFGGMTADELARALGVSPRTIGNDWRYGRAWLRTHWR